MTDWNKELQKATERMAELATAVIRKDGPPSKPYCVYSEKTGRNFGCYPSKKQAQKRLAEIEKFKHMSENQNNGHCRGCDY